MGGLVAVVLLFAVAAVLHGLGLRGRRQLGELSALEATTVGDLLAEANSVVATLGPGALRRPAKLTGIGRPGSPPLTGPFSGEPVLWSETTIHHHYWAETVVTDKQGRKQIKCSKRAELLSRHVTVSGTLVLDDGSGSIDVELENARIDGAVTIFDRMSPSLPHVPGPFSTTASKAAKTGVNTIGFKCVEKAIRADVPLFVHGTAATRSGASRVRLIHDTALPLLISARTEQAVVSGRRNVARAQSAVAVASAIVGLVVGAGSIVGTVTSSPEATAVPAAAAQEGDRRAAEETAQRAAEDAAREAAERKAAEDAARRAAEEAVAKAEAEAAAAQQVTAQKAAAEAAAAEAAAAEAARVEAERQAQANAAAEAQRQAAAQPPAPAAAGGTDPRFRTCREANASGYGPYRSGADPEYAWYRDADNDGVNCES
jgi:hypothetical protein